MPVNRHRQQSSKGQTRDQFEQEDNHNVPKKRSLGALRKNKKTKPRSPDATGKLHLQRHTLKEIYRQLGDGNSEVICNIACWRNSDEDGPYLTVEISPQFISFERRQSNRDAFHDMFNEEFE
jgi:hypothetical protein